MLNLHHRKRIWVWLNAVLLVAAFSDPAARGVEKGPAGTATDFQATICGLMARGEFDRSREILARAIRQDPDNPALKRLSGWYDDWKNLAERRKALRQRLLEAHIGFSKKMAQAKLWQWALKGVLDAVDIAENPEQIRDAEWVRPIVQARLTEAERYYKRGKWLDAYQVYDRLHKLYEDNQEYQEQADRCKGRARLTAIYNKQNNWKRQLRDVDFTLVAEVFRRIDWDYVEPPDFKKITLGGLKRLVLLGTTPRLREVFAELENEPKRVEYVEGMEQLIADCKKQEKLGFQEATDRFDDAFELNRRTLQLDDRLITYEFLRAAMDELDAFSAIIWPNEVRDFIKGTRGEFTGVGIQIRKDEPTQRLLVVTPLEGTPAYNAGIEPEDLIFAVDGRDTKGMDLEEAVRRITGKPGSTVRLTIQRIGKDGKPMRRDFTLTRDRITIRTVKGYRRPRDVGGWDFMIDPDNKIGYIRVTHFMQQTVEDLKKAIQQLRRNGMKALILDLRDNPGGLMVAAVQMADLFLAEGDIVSTESREGATNADDNKVEKATRAHTLPMFPLAVIINELSASASEIVSGALQDHHRAVIIGERSFGKASVQKVFGLLKETCLLKLTTAHYKVPSGRNIHRMPGAKTWGVTPDVPVKMMAAEEFNLRKASLNRDVIHSNHRSQDNWRVVEPEQDRDRTGKGKSSGPQDKNKRPGGPDRSQNDRENLSVQELAERIGERWPDLDKAKIARLIEEARAAVPESRPAFDDAAFAEQIKTALRHQLKDVPERDIAAFYDTIQRKFARLSRFSDRELAESTQTLKQELTKLNELINGIQADDAQLQAALLVMRARLMAQTDSPERPTKQARGPSAVAR